MKKNSGNFAMEIISEMKRRLIRCRIVLTVSLVGNIILAAVLFFK